MSNQNPYEQLGVTEDSSFEEIQAVRDRLFAEYQGDRKQLEAIEAAYDSVLMDRLRMRQEGKIKVPDRIRFPEKMVQPPPSPAPTVPAKAPDWLQRLLDTPTQADIWQPAGILAALGTVVVFVPFSLNVLQMALVAGLGSSFFFLYRKERKLGRSVLLGLTGLIAGFVVGGLIGSLLQAQLSMIGLKTEEFATIVTFVILWLISSFLR